MAAPRPDSRSDTRSRLLDAAGAVFAARGYRGATLREIAGRAGANLAAANYHFGSKQQLYLEVAREHFERLERRLAERGAAAPADLGGLSRETLVGLLHERVRTMLQSFLVEDPVHGTLMQREFADPSEALPVIVRRWVEPLRREMERILAQLAPELPPAAIERCARSVMGQGVFYLTHRPALLLMMRRRGYPPGFVDEITDHVTQFSLGGLARLSARRRA